MDDTRAAPEVLTGSVTAIYVYPVKSCQGVEVKSSQFSNHGLLYDRQWAIVSTRTCDGDGSRLPGESEVAYVHNQYDDHPELASIVIELSEDYLIMSHSG